MNNMCKNHKVLLPTELNFFNNTKARGKILFGLQECHHYKSLNFVKCFRLSNTCCIAGHAIMRKQNKIQDHKMYKYMYKCKCTNAVQRDDVVV